MPVPSYRGSTYVGYLDISGFKQMMENKRKATSVLDKFYRTLHGAIYEVNSTSPSNVKMNVIAVSDCAVLFLSEENNYDVGEILGLPKMLQFVRYVNCRFITNDFPFMTTCSISYGDFGYEDRNEREYVRKNCIYGTAYVNSFLDSRLEQPKLKPGECRLLKKGLTVDFREHEAFSLLGSRRGYFYYYWMLKDAGEKKKFRRKLKQTSEELYTPMIELLQKSIGEF